LHVAQVLRDDALVTVANIAGQLDLGSLPDEICVPVMDALLHWASCRAPSAVDPLPTVTHCQHPVSTAGSSTDRDPVSAQRLALEALSKLCVSDSNVDLLLATPPFHRLVAILGNLIGAMADPDCDPVWREFGVVLASSLVSADPGVARALALHRATLPAMVGFVESAAADSGGTSPADTVRRAATVLAALAELPEGRTDLERRYQSRIVQLAVCDTLDGRVLSTLADILHVICTRNDDQHG